MKTKSVAVRFRCGLIEKKEFLFVIIRHEGSISLQHYFIWLVARKNVRDSFFKEFIIVGFLDNGKMYF